MPSTPERPLFSAFGLFLLFVYKFLVAPVNGATIVNNAAVYDEQYQDIGVLEVGTTEEYRNVSAVGRRSSGAAENDEAGQMTHVESLEKRLPKSLIIGVKKAGTRALLEFLRLHPDVRATGPETHFFDRHYRRGIEWYRRQMPPSLPDQITMEKTPSYFVTSQVPPRIRSMSPEVRLLVVVRDPVTRALSDYAQTASKRPNSTPSFESLAFHGDEVDSGWSAIRIGLYADHLSRWLDHFPARRIHVVSGEELVRDPAQEMALVQDFLGLHRLVSRDHFYFNRTKGFPCLKKSEGSGNPHCLGKTKGRAHPRLAEIHMRRLRSFFEPHNQRFYRMVGRDFHWDGNH